MAADSRVECTPYDPAASSRSGVHVCVCVQVCTYFTECILVQWPHKIEKNMLREPEKYMSTTRTP